ncbi:serine/threonine-protein kinase [uncultured Pseudodesulfovibrio sp.]|uniref:serine/threonine-protein kinase n=1 Tax=uncultured Pseudodesulfovibrio sp. TaxID=2035858 RepID=UPI0029C97523|nr:serine/threonine-protein kinase [uncultured Pseudodesulfovibrio sp.]
MTNSDTPPEKELGGYRLGKVLGRGAMGVVYRGMDASSGQEVAIKTLRPDLLSSDERDTLLQRFLHEANISKSLRHENIIHVIDSGQEGEDVFMAMELVLGKELKELLASGSSIDLDRAEALFARLLSALSYSHKQGIIHRDIKPANILLVGSDGVKVMDFGIARIESSEMTQAGAMLGTPSYMSPEQVIGEKVDRRTDIYSTGVILYQLLTGRKPFQGSLTQVMQQVLNNVPPAPSAVNVRVSRAFDSVVARSMAKERDGRFQDAGEFSAALAEAFSYAREEEEANEATVLMDTDATMLDDGTMLADMNGPETISRLGKEIRELLQTGLDDTFSDSTVHNCQALLNEYVESAVEASGGSLPPADPRLAAVLERDCSVFADTVLPSLKELIISGAPLPGKQPSLDDRSDWMGCIDMFMTLVRTLENLGRPGNGATLGMAVRSELLNASMMYTGQINAMLFSPDHLELVKIAADFMRLDILEWGLEVLGGNMEMQQIANQINMLSGQVLKRVSAAIRDFIESRDALARFDVASLLYQIEELIVIGERTLETQDDAGYQKTLGRDIVIEFIDATRLLVNVSAEELMKAASDTESNGAEFAAKLRQLGGLFLFTTRLDDEVCREQLIELSKAIRDAVEALVPIVETGLNTTDDDAASLRQDQLTAIWELAESLGWSNLSGRLLSHVRDGMLHQSDE